MTRKANRHVFTLVLSMLMVLFQLPLTSYAANTERVSYNPIGGYYCMHLERHAPMNVSMNPTEVDSYNGCSDATVKKMIASIVLADEYLEEKNVDVRSAVGQTSGVKYNITQLTIWNLGCEENGCFAERKHGHFDDGALAYAEYVNAHYQDIDYSRVNATIYMDPNNARRTEADKYQDILKASITGKVSLRHEKHRK